MTAFRVLCISAACLSVLINTIAGVEEDDNSMSTMFTKFPGHALKNNTVAEYHVTSEMICGLKCLQRNWCLSYNYYKPVINKQKCKCELNDANRLTCPSCLEKDPDATYHEEFQAKVQLGEDFWNKTAYAVEPLTYDVTFLNKGTVSYMDLPLPLSIHMFTLCFWMKTADQERGTPFSYAISATENELTIKKDAFYINGYFVSISLPDYFDGIWHHACIAWANAQGSWKVTVDGVITDSGSAFQTGHVIKGGGVVVIGQDQDVTPGDPSEFDLHESFVGSLSGLNLWDTILLQDEVVRMSGTCNEGNGYVFQWLNFEKKTKLHGDVIIEEPSSCQVPR